MNIPEGKVLPTFLALAAGETEAFEPRTRQQAKDDPNWLEWENGIADEINSLKQNKTWELVDSPKQRRILSGKWIFKLKRGQNGEIIPINTDGWCEGSHKKKALTMMKLSPPWLSQ